MLEHTGPVWLDKLDNRIGGVDHLGLRLPGLQMADALLPGITNTTRRVRNYSLIAWMHYHASGKDAKYMRALESAFVHATRRHEHGDILASSGVVGSQSVPPEDENRLLPLFRDEPMVSVLRADFYGPSAQRLGIAGKDSSGSHAYLPIAKRLADAIHVSPEKIVPPGHHRIRSSDADALSPLCLCQPPGGQERELLIEILFRLNEPRTQIPDLEEKVDRPRRLSLALILIALNKAENPEPFLLQRFLDWGLKRQEWSPPKVLEEYAYGWAVQGMRWHFRHALETVWAGFGRLIDEYKFPRACVKPFVETVFESSDAKDIWLPEPTFKVGELDAIIPNDAGAELQGHMKANDWLDKAPEKAILIASTQLAVIACRVERLLDPDRFYGKFPYLGEPDRVSLAGFSGRFEKQMMVKDWVEHLIERYAIGQHFLTGARKWTTGIDAFFFHPTSEGYRLFKDGFRWYPDPGATKIQAALQMLCDLGLVKHATHWQTTKDGKALANQCLNLH